MNEDKHCQKIDSCKVGIDEKCNDIPGFHCVNAQDYSVANDYLGHFCHKDGDGVCYIELKPCSEIGCKSFMEREWLPNPRDSIGQRYICNEEEYKYEDGITDDSGERIHQLHCNMKPSTYGTDETSRPWEPSDVGVNDKYYPDGCPVIRDEDCSGFWSICKEDCTQEFIVTRNKVGGGKGCIYNNGDTKECINGLCCEGIICPEPSTNCKDGSKCFKGVCQSENNLPDGSPCEYEGDELNGICSNGECSATIEDGDCIGEWGVCSINCVKEYNITRLRTGSGDVCEYRMGSHTICEPGEGDCPLDKTENRCNNVCQSTNECKDSLCQFINEDEYKCIEENKRNNTLCHGGLCRDGLCISSECPLGCPDPTSECKISGLCLGDGICSEEQNKSDGTFCSKGVCKEGECSQTNECRAFDCRIKENSKDGSICNDNECTEEKCCRGDPLPNVTCNQYLDFYPCKGEEYTENNNEIISVNTDGSTNCCSDLICNEQPFCDESKNKCIKDEKKNIIVKECISAKMDSYELKDGFINKCPDTKECIYPADIELKNNGKLVEWASTLGDANGIQYKHKNDSNIHIKAPIGMIIEFVTYTPTKIVKYRTNNNIITNTEKFLKEEAYSPSIDIDGWAGLYYKKNENEDWSYLKNTYYVRALCNTKDCDQDCSLTKECGLYCEEGDETYIIDIPKSGKGKPCNVVSNKNSIFRSINGILLIIGFLLLIIIIIKKSGPKIKVRKGNTLSSRTINVISADTLAELIKNKNI